MKKVNKCQPFIHNYKKWGIKKNHEFIQVSQINLLPFVWLRITDEGPIPKRRIAVVSILAEVSFLYINNPYVILKDIFNMKLNIMCGSCGWSLAISSIFVRKQVLRLVQYLVSFGFYNKQEEIKRLLEPMMGMIDGRCDKPYPDIPKGMGRHEIKSSN